MKKENSEYHKIRNDKMRTWLKQHDFLNIAKICRRIGYNRGSFSHFEEGHKELGEKTLQKLEFSLIDYGYKP